MRTPPPGLAVRVEAARILDRVDRAGAFASDLLRAAEDRFDDPRDRALLHHVVLGVLRRRPAVDALLERGAARAIDAIDADVRAALRVAAYSIAFLDRVPTFAAVSCGVETVRGLRPKAAGFANATLRAIARDPDPPVSSGAGEIAALALAHGFPSWWVARRVADAGPELARRALERDNEPAEVVLRVVRGASIDDVRRRLEGDGVVCEPGRFAPRALRVVSGSPWRSSVFGGGLVAVQDEAAQLVTALAAGATEGPWLDACAAPGGKSLQWAEDLPDGSALVAIDRSRKRLGRLVEAGARLRPDRRGRVLPVVADLERPVPSTSSFGAVLVDAPCSGTGTVRRHPEIRWRLGPEDFARLAARQLAILRSCADGVRNGGRLVYAVCSVEREEGRDVVERFLATSGAFRPVDAARYLPESASGLVDGDGAMRTGFPAEGIDGFYAAVFERTG